MLPLPFSGLQPSAVAPGSAPLLAGGACCMCAVGEAVAFEGQSGSFLEGSFGQAEALGRLL